MASSLLQRTLGMWTYALQPNKGTLLRLGFCPCITSNSDAISWLEIVGVRFYINAAIVYCQYWFSRLATIITHLDISLIILFNLMAQLFSWRVHGTKLFHLIPCFLRKSCASLLTYLLPLFVFKHFTLISCCFSNATWYALNSFNCYDFSFKNPKSIQPLLLSRYVTMYIILTIEHICIRS